MQAAAKFPWGNKIKPLAQAGAAVATQTPLTGLVPAGQIGGTLQLAVWGLKLAPAGHVGVATHFGDLVSSVVPGGQDGGLPSETQFPRRFNLNPGEQVWKLAHGPNPLASRFIPGGQVGGVSEVQLLNTCLVPAGHIAATEAGVAALASPAIIAAVARKKAVINVFIFISQDRKFNEICQGTLLNLSQTILDAGCRCQSPIFHRSFKER
jgi:hypothetical protein